LADTIQEPAVFKRSVVVVEDESFLRSLIVRALETAGFKVASAASASEARILINDIDPDAVVLDIDLGDGPTGLEIGEALLATSNKIAVIYLTMLTDPRFIESTATVHPRAAYLDKRRISDISFLIDALEAVLHEADVTAYRDDLRSDRSLAQLSATQINVLHLIAEGKTNQQIAIERGRSLSATEGTISRTFLALGITVDTDLNARVVAVRRFINDAGIRWHDA
jgi:DNA-binding NarL/FixJ family response regulator